VIGEEETTGELGFGEALEGDELYELLFGGWEEETTAEDEGMDFPGDDDDDDELYNLLFGED